MQTVARKMSRRYTYSGRWSARQLSDAIYALNLTTGAVARMTGVNILTINRMLKDDQDVPVHLQMTLCVWRECPEALRLAHEWANEHAQDVRGDE